jgi:hypothetical protein
MISKKIFVETIENIHKEEEKLDKFNQALYEISDGYPIFNPNNLYLKSLLDILEYIFHDTAETIQWYLYENVEKKIWLADGTEIDVSTPEKLYDYLIDCMIEDGIEVKIVSEKEPVVDSEPIVEAKSAEEDHRPRYLIIADKPLYANELKKTYESLGSDIQYDADFAWLNCLVVNIDTPCHYTDINGNDIDIINGGVYPDYFKNQLTVEPLILGVGDFSEHHRIFHGGAYNKDANNEILELLAHNEYDAIINATNSTNENNLAFEWMLESLNMGNFTTKALAMFYHEPDSFKRELLLLNNFESECEEILDILM